MLIAQNLRRAACAQPDRTAVEFEGEKRTWRALLHRVQRVAGGLRASGLQPGDRIAILSENNLPFFELYFAAPWAGLIMASLNTRWSPREMAEALNDCGATALIVAGEFGQLTEALRRAAPSLRLVIAADAAAEPFADTSWTQLAQSAPAADGSLASDEAAYIFYTGGTTGRAKGVMLTARNIYIAGLSGLHTAGFSAASTSAISVPLFHMSGGGFVATQTAAAGGARLLRKFEPDSSMAAVESSRATHVIWVPTMMTMVLNSPAFGRYDLGSLERIIYGSAPMPQAILDRALAALPKVRFNQYYGMTEVSGNATWLGPEEHARERAGGPRLRSVGVPIPGVEVAVLRADGARADADEVGEICIRGPTVMKGYWGQPAKTAEAVQDGWMHTGDAGRQDQDGFVFLVDRLKDMIITGGENVYSTEVENAVYAHPSVKECAVIGLPDEKWGELVCAVVHLADGADPDEAALIEHCRSLIGGYKIPRRVIFTPEPLPKSAAGKILKTEIRRLHADGG